ncbi:hypothetical protein IEO21_06176 [Rhodonia placenta]|uniref:Lysophospholipase n=1 Tax=Rhodonia placenta TaxID=104341 RepID=A0A8H7P0K2_9APHY|nr:hypothetical protein IEO21_06176 [Postia placenta]
MANYYAPHHVSCPSESLIRQAGTPQAKNQTLHPNEQKYVRARKQIAKQSMQSWLGSNMTKVYSGDFSKLSVDDVPNIAISVSGGNFRAALFGAASLEMFDARVHSSVDAGLGGLLQSSAYITALSGGSYLSTSLMFNEFPMLSDLVFGNDTLGIPGWQLDVNLFQPGPSGEYTTAFFTHLYDDLGAKQSQGFPVTFCDFWGRALSYHFLPGTNGTESFASNTTAGNHAASLSYSSATQLQTWKDQTMPFPIVLMDVNSPQAQGNAFGDTGVLPLTSVVYELTPFEFGSYDPQLAAFVELPYLGSTFHSGAPSSCVNSFDNAGLMIGTSSCDFHQYNVTDNVYWKAEFEPLIANLTKVFGQHQPGQEMDVTSVANPFYEMHAGTYQDAQETNLSLLDGSLDVENDPVLPLLVKARRLDVVIVLDSSGETNDVKPSGLSLLATKEKAVVLPSGTINFPTPFPNSTDEFVSKGLNVRPVFFGCDGPTKQEEAFP